jgi:HPr kinase/phosphorylase
LQRRIDHSRIQKSGLAMVGHLHGLVPSRVQVLGETELSFVAALSDEGRAKAARDLFSLRLACVLITRGAAPPPEFVAQASATDTPLLITEARSSVAISALHALLDERLAPRTRIHGVLVDVYEVGILLLGNSGVGKSEVALELVMRGHKLVADDVVECDYRPPGMVFAEPAEPLRHHSEVRGLGILNIRDLFGVTAIRERKRIDLLVRLETTLDESKFERLGQRGRMKEVLSVPLPEIVIPVRPGRNVSDIIEIAARDELLRRAGVDASSRFVENIDRQLSQAPPSHQPEATTAEAIAARLRSGARRHFAESSVPPPLETSRPRSNSGTRPGRDDD